MSRSEANALDDLTRRLPAMSNGFHIVTPEGVIEVKAQECGPIMDAVQQTLHARLECEARTRNLHATVLQTLKEAYPAGMRQARSALVLPLPGSVPQATEPLDLGALLRIAYVCVDPENPTLPPLQISALLGAAGLPPRGPKMFRPRHDEPDH